MNKLLLTLSFALSLNLAFGQTLFYESFDRCIDEEDENYGYTGGNDGQWGGDIAKAIVIYTDNKNFSNFNYCNGAYQCIKIGTSSKQGSATTPAISCNGDVTLSFRAAPWDQDNTIQMTVTATGGTLSQGVFDLEKGWNNISVNISDVQGSLTLSFSTISKKRIFLDDILVVAADPNAAAIHVSPLGNVDFGYVSRNYSAMSQTLTITGTSLAAAGISLSIDNDDDNLFSVSPAILPAQGGDVTITCAAGASSTLHGANLVLSATDANDPTKQVQKNVTLMIEVSSLNLQGSGTKDDPFTVADVLLLAQHSSVWSSTFYWVTGYVLGGVGRYNNTFDHISTTDNLSLVLADSPTETDMNNIITVQLNNGAARTNLNVRDNPELIGQSIKVQGILLTDDATSDYLGKTGVRSVCTEDQYVRPDKPTAAENIYTNRTPAEKLLLNGHLFIRRNNLLYTPSGQIIQH